MIGYRLVGQRLQAVEDALSCLDELIWLDLHAEPPDVIAALEQRLGLDIPTEDEMAEIEISSRLYQEAGSHFMTATLPAQSDQDDAIMAPVSFVIHGRMLLTVRTSSPRAFATFPQRAAHSDLGLSDAASVLLRLLEAVVDRLADILERASRDIDAISLRIFNQVEQSPGGKSSYQDVLRQLGRKGDLVSDLLESLMTLSRISSYLALVGKDLNVSRSEREHQKTLSRDIQSISEHAGFMSQKVTFLLDATLGMINIEQNATIKIFSVLAVIFMPPTMIASIYGMNFALMPELQWPYGYPLALLLMLLAAILPYWYFKRRGWL
ncbi:MAG: magnesium transporter CorA family protein [Gammaproteobacteria bacterium]|nr:magnesium transporter CorA family protein [Gammaproteobacteria bacterium]